MWESWFLFHAPYYRSYSGKTGETENDRKSDSGYSADFTISSIPTAYISSHLQVEPGAGNTKWAHIAMGLQDTESAPGWYNTYNEATFVENNYDTHATAKVSQDNIKESLRHFAADPEYAWSFLTENGQFCGTILLLNVSLCRVIKSRM